MASLQEQSADLFGKNPELKYKTVEEIKENVGQTPYKPTLKELAKDLYIPASFLPVIGTGIAIKEMPEVAQQAYTLLKQGKSESDLIKMGLGAGLGVLVAADVLPYAKKVTDPLKSKIKNVASQMSDALTPQAVTPEGISADIPKVDSKILKNEVVDYYRKKGGTSRQAQEEVDNKIFFKINDKHRIPKHELLKDKKGEPLKLYMGLQNPTKLGDKFKHTFGKDPFDKKRIMVEGQKPVGFASSNPLLADGFASRYLRAEDMKYNVFSGQNVVPFYVKPKKVIEYKPFYGRRGNMEVAKNWFEFDKQALTLPEGHVLVWRDGIEQHTRVIPELQEAIPNVKFNEGDVYAFGENVPVFSAISGEELTDIAPKPIPSWMLNQPDRNRYVEYLKQMKQDSPVLKELLDKAEEITFKDMEKIISEGINKGLDRKGIKQLLQDKGFDDNMIQSFYNRTYLGVKHYDRPIDVRKEIQSYANEKPRESFFDKDDIREEFTEQTGTNLETGYADSNKFWDEFAPTKDKKPVVKTKSPSNINKINNVQLLEDFPRYVYHSSRGVRDTSEGIKKYEHRDFGEKGLNLPKGKGIYLSQEPFQPDAIKIDITKLPINSRKDISYTGQAEGYIYSTVDIPKEAIVKTKSPLRVIFDRLPEDVKKSIPKQKDSTGLTGYHGTASSRKKGEPFFDRDFISKTDQLLDEGFYFTLNPKKAAEYANMRGIKGQSFLENDAMSRRRILSGENVKHNKQTNPTTKPAFLLKTKDGEIATSASLLKGEDIYGNPISAGQSISRFDLSNLEKPYIVKHYTGSDKKLLAQAKRDEIKLKKNIQKIKEDGYDSVIFEDFKDGSMQIMVFPEHINKIKSFNKGGTMKNEMKKLKLKGGALVSSTALLGEILPSKSQLGDMIRETAPGWSANADFVRQLSDNEIYDLLEATSVLLGRQLKAKAKGGYIAKNFAEGGLQDEGGTVDPVSGNEVPSGSTQEEVRDDIPAMLSEGEFVFPADVVRFIGLEKLMAMRQKAKEGLAKMEAMGQMGNSEEAVLPDDIPFDINDIEMEDDEKPQGFKEGGGYMYNPSGEPSDVYNPSTGADLLGDSATGAPKTFNKRYVNPETGEVRFIPFLGEPPEGSGPLYPIDDLLAAGFVHQPIAEETDVDEEVLDDSKQEDKEDKSILVGGKSIREGQSLSQADLDKMGIVEDKNFLGMPYLKNAPQGWNSQKQKEFNAMKAEGLNPKAQWTGSEWRIYSKALDGTEFGTPGKADRDSIFKSTYAGSGMGLKSVIDSVTGEVDFDKLYQQNLMSAMQKQGMQPKTVSEKYGDRGFTKKTLEADKIQADLTNVNASRPEVIKNELSGDRILDIDEEKPAVGDGSLEAAMNVKKAKAEEEAKVKAEAELRLQKQLADQKAKAEEEKAKRDAEIRQAQASKFSSMGQSDKFKNVPAYVVDAGGKSRSAKSQGGKGVTTNLRSFEKGGLLKKAPKKKRVMKRGGLASKK